MGVWGGLGRGLGTVGRGPDPLLFPSNLGGFFPLVPDSPELQAGAGGLRGCLGRAWRKGGVSSRQSQGFGAQEQGGPLPQPQAQAALSLRSWTGQHSCGRGPLPPACLNLAPASDDLAPPPPTGTGLREPAGKDPVLGVCGAGEACPS